jgi:hypothetical protein
MDIRELSNLYDSYVAIYEMKSTRISKSREAYINPDQSKDWKHNKELNWGETHPKVPSHKEAMVKRLKFAIGTQRRQDKETGMREHVLDYLVNEGYVDSYESAECVLEAMSDEWLESIVEAKKAKIMVDVNNP